jgi:hypothetical protein
MDTICQVTRVINLIGACIGAQLDVCVGLAQCLDTQPQKQIVCSTVYGAGFYTTSNTSCLYTTRGLSPCLILDDGTI